MTSLTDHCPAKPGCVLRSGLTCASSAFHSERSRRSLSTNWRLSMGGSVNCNAGYSTVRRSCVLAANEGQKARVTELVRTNVAALGPVDVAVDGARPPTLIGAER